LAFCNEYAKEIVFSAALEVCCRRMSTSPTDAATMMSEAVTELEKLDLKLDARRRPLLPEIE
jgi:hypothetical protein